MLILFARQGTLWPALVLLGVVGLVLGTLNTAVSPLFMHIIPHDLMGRVISVFSTLQTLCNLISISLAGLLGTLLVGFHTNLLGATYAMLNLRSLKLEG